MLELDVLRDPDPVTEPRYWFAENPKNRGNGKLGPGIIGVYGEQASCPTRCPFKVDAERQCFGGGFTLIRKWEAVSVKGWNLSGLVDRLRKQVYRGMPWRFGVVGDLPAKGGILDREALEALASVGGDGWCYTHHDLSLPANREAVASVAGRFSVNQSCDTVEQVEAALDAGVPATIVGPEVFRSPVRTERGTLLVPCPATLPDSTVTCARCTLCRSSSQDRTRRRVAVVFPAHGNGPLLRYALAIVARSGLLELMGLR